MNEQFAATVQRALKLWGVFQNATHAKALVVLIITALASFLFLFKSCSPEPTNPDLIPGKASQLVDDLRTIHEEITPPDTEEIEVEVEDEIRTSQDDDSMFMDAPNTSSSASD
tara:strand:+ start:4102 stop:4440 length:339 start_codon:yes stop_codon:yes gene_type:complete